LLDSLLQEICGVWNRNPNKKKINSNMAAIVRSVGLLARPSCQPKMAETFLRQAQPFQNSRFGIRLCSGGKPAAAVVQDNGGAKTEVKTNSEYKERVDDLNKSHGVTDLQKRILVHFKHFPDIDSVPERVSKSMMMKAMSQARIKVSFIMMVTALFLCFCTAWYGKTHQYETSLVEINQRRHEAYKIGKDSGGGRLSLILPAKEETKDE